MVDVTTSYGAQFDFILFIGYFNRDCISDPEPPIIFSSRCRPIIRLKIGGAPPPISSAGSAPDYGRFSNLIAFFWEY